MSQPQEALTRLLALVARLRGPGGCPWDREQTPLSVTPYLLEEAYEAAEAVEQGAPEQACGELGDLLFQLVFLAHLYDEDGQFDLAQVIEAVVEKMTRRHPHVFGQASAEQPEQVRQLWGRIKEQERTQNQQGQAGLLASVPQAAPALSRAQRLGQRAAQVGFDWPGAAQVWDKVGEELAELEQAGDPPEVERELGDLLFSLVQWARHQGMDAEAALRGANRRFASRFGRMERMMGQRGLQWREMDMTRLDQLWEEAKAAEKKRPPGKNA